MKVNRNGEQYLPTTNNLNHSTHLSNLKPLNTEMTITETNVNLSLGWGPVEKSDRDINLLSQLLYR